MKNDEILNTVENVAQDIVDKAATGTGIAVELAEVAADRIFSRETLHLLIIVVLIVAMMAVPFVGIVGPMVVEAAGLDDEAPISIDAESIDLDCAITEAELAALIEEMPLVAETVETLEDQGMSRADICLRVGEFCEALETGLNFGNNETAADQMYGELVDDGITEGVAGVLANRSHPGQLSTENSAAPARSTRMGGVPELATTGDQVAGTLTEGVTFQPEGFTQKMSAAATKVKEKLARILSGRSNPEQPANDIEQRNGNVVLLQAFQPFSESEWANFASRITVDEDGNFSATIPFFIGQNGSGTLPFEWLEPGSPAFNALSQVQNLFIANQNPNNPKAAIGEFNLIISGSVAADGSAEAGFAVQIPENHPGVQLGLVPMPPESEFFITPEGTTHWITVTDDRIAGVGFVPKSEIADLLAAKGLTTSLEDGLTLVAYDVNGKPLWTIVEGRTVSLEITAAERTFDLVANQNMNVRTGPGTNFVNVNSAVLQNGVLSGGSSLRLANFDQAQANLALNNSSGASLSEDAEHRSAVVNNEGFVWRPVVVSGDLIGWIATKGGNTSVSATPEPAIDSTFAEPDLIDASFETPPGQGNTQEVPVIAPTQTELPPVAVAAPEPQATATAQAVAEVPAASEARAAALANVPAEYWPYIGDDVIHAIVETMDQGGISWAYMTDSGILVIETQLFDQNFDHEPNPLFENSPDAAAYWNRFNAVFVAEKVRDLVNTNNLVLDREVNMDDVEAYYGDVAANMEYYLNLPTSITNSATGKPYTVRELTIDMQTNLSGIAMQDLNPDYIPLGTLADGVKIFVRLGDNPDSLASYAGHDEGTAIAINAVSNLNSTPVFFLFNPSVNDPLTSPKLRGISVLDHLEAADMFRSLGRRSGLSRFGESNNNANNNILDASEFILGPYFVG